MVGQQGDVADFIEEQGAFFSSGKAADYVFFFASVNAYAL
jgi:hypothetical protein